MNKIELLGGLYEVFVEKYPEWRASISVDFVPRKDTYEITLFSKPTHYNAISESGEENATLRLDWELSETLIEEMGDDYESIANMMVSHMENDVRNFEGIRGIKEIKRVA